MTPLTVHLGVYDTLSDWEHGHAVGHIHAPEFQKSPGRYQVQTVGLGTDPVTTRGGVRILPDLKLSDLEPEDSAMLILPGADIAMTGGLEPFAAMARRFLDADVPVAAICGATFALAQEGLLDDCPHTSNARAYIEMSGYSGIEHYSDDLAVRSDLLVTANATAPAHFAAEIFALLDLYTPSTLASWKKLFIDHDEAGFFEMMMENGD